MCIRDRGRRVGEGRGGPAVEHVDGEVEEDRPAVGGGGQRERVAHLVGDAVRRGDRTGRLRDGRDHGDVVQFLEGAGAPAALGGPAAEDHERGAVEPGARHGADAVGDARPGGEQGDAGAAGELGVRLRGEDGGLFVADVDDAQPGLGRGVQQREDVAAGQCEDGVHAGVPQGGHGQFAALRVDVTRGAHGRSPAPGAAIEAPGGKKGPAVAVLPVMTEVPAV